MELRACWQCLNMAINLEGALPIGTIIEASKTAGIMLSDDAGNQLCIEDLTSIAAPFGSDEPFWLVKSALIVTGMIHDKMLLLMDLRIRTWANIPHNSSLGTSSVLAAAVVKGLLQVTEGDDRNEVARLVLVLEQLMGTGGGWQDQIGGSTRTPGAPKGGNPISQMGQLAHLKHQLPR